MLKLSLVAPRDSDELKIEDLIEEHAARMYRLGLKLCGSREDAEDLVQETFLRAYQNWDQFEGRSDPFTWLYTIAARVCIRRHRRRSGEPDRIESLNELLPASDHQIPDVPESADGPLELLERQEVQEAVEMAISGLPLSFRLPFVLKELMDFSVADVSEILGLKKSTVKTRIHRARLVVRKALAKELPRRKAPRPDHNRQLCLDLLQAKQEALDRNAPFPLASQELCARCHSVFVTLDMARNVCHEITRGQLPESLRQALIERVAGHK
jgi:RNA polymerase sigma-70 factor (ECF subfamily)